MGQDDDRDCAEHVWALQGAFLRSGESTLEYQCARCGAVELRAANRAPGMTKAPSPFGAGPFGDAAG